MLGLYYSWQMSEQCSPHEAQVFKCSLILQSLKTRSALIHCQQRSARDLGDIKPHVSSQEEGAAARTFPLLIMNGNTASSVLLVMNSDGKGRIQKLMTGQRFSLARVKIKSCRVRKEKGPKCPQNFHMTFRYQ